MFVHPIFPQEEWHQWIAKSKVRPPVTDELNQPSFALPQTFYIHYDEIDAQHEGLVEIINACLAKLVDGVLEDFEEPFEEFITQLATHSRHEESLMRDLEFSGLE